MAKKSFPDLTGDGKVTKKDILKGRGVEGFKEGGSVRRPAPTEKPSSDDPLMEALEQERRIQEANEPEEPKKKKKLKRRGDDRKVETFAEGGMVRGCKGVQTSGKGFKGTF